MQKLLKIEKLNISNAVLSVLLLAVGVFNLILFVNQNTVIRNIKSDLFSTEPLVPEYYKSLSFLLFACGCFVIGFYVFRNCISFIQLVGLSGITMSFILKLIVYVFFYENTDFANQPLFIVSDALAIVISGFAFYVVIKSTDIIFTLVDVAVALNLLYIALVIFCCFYYYGTDFWTFFPALFNALALGLGYLALCNTCIRISNKNNSVRLNVKIFSSKENRPEIKSRLKKFKEYQEWYRLGFISFKEFFTKGSDVLGKDNLEKLKDCSEKVKAGELTREQFNEIKKEILGVK